MTERELHKLKRQELLEILVSLRKELDSETEKNNRLRIQLEEKDSEVLRLLRLLCEAQGIDTGCTAEEHDENESESGEQ